MSTVTQHNMEINNLHFTHDAIMQFDKNCTCELRSSATVYLFAHQL